MRSGGCWEYAVIGAGPAGCAAAIDLARAGARVGLLERGTFPRHKVCGEFLSPEVARVLEELGCGERFRAARPAPIERALLVLPSGARLEFPLPEPAWGLSRRCFDHLLAQAAQQAGAELVERAEVCRAGELLEARDGRTLRAGRVLLAAGRHSLLQPAAPRGREYFGVKAHYDGECSGRVELYFFDGGYCGLAPVEDGRVNVCCLLDRRLLAGRSAEQVLEDVPALRERLRSLRRVMPFLHTGPVTLGWRQTSDGLLAAGDAALFIDPFTGDGMSLALQTGRLAAQHALAGVPAAAHAAEMRRRFTRQLRAARVLRVAASRLWLAALLRAVPFVPFRNLALTTAFRLTRGLR